MLRYNINKIKLISYHHFNRFNQLSSSVALNSTNQHVNDGIKSHRSYEKLLEPLQLRGGITLKNRILMGSMHTGLEESGLIGSGGLENMAAFYEERAKGGVGLIVTGGISPNFDGCVYLGAAQMSTSNDSYAHRIVTDTVHKNSGKIAMQILHSGRYAYHPWPVSASAIKSPIGWYKPKALSRLEVYRTIDDFVHSAVLAKAGGYDGVEVMGSEGYLINQFLVKRTNHRSDEFGGSYENRMRFPVEIVKRIREAVGEDFIIIYRLSMLDLVDDGSSWEEIVELAHRIESSGASIINTGIGWHEARIPTIATAVPRGAYTWVTKRLKSEVSIPLCTTNRINSPDTAEDILQSGSADMISMARPFLADPYFVQKTIEGRVDEINTCIGCNQACLDNGFKGEKVTCLVNPRAGFETSFHINNVSLKKKKNIAVVGAGPAGLAFSTTAASRGHSVTLFEKDKDIGGQFNIAKLIPGKEEFYETLRYFRKQIDLTGVNLRLSTEVSEKDLQSYDVVVVATGVIPRKVTIPNKSSKVKVHSYIDVLKHGASVGQSVAVIGAGGIGFDTAEFLTHPLDSHSDSSFTGPKQQVDGELVKSFLEEWGVDTSVSRGGLSPSPKSIPSQRKVYLLQRKKGKLGAGLGKTTGWIHRTTLKKRNVEEISGCKYIEINDDGLVIEVDGKQKTLPVDTVVICAGQESLKSLFDPVSKSGKPVFLIGGSQEAGELDAKRAIDQATRLAAVVEDAKTGEVFKAEEEFNHKIFKYIKSFMGK